MKRYLLAALFLFYYCNISSAQSIDPTKSSVEFIIGNMGFMSVSGTITGMRGMVSFDPYNLNKSSFDVTIDPASINTDNKKRDQHLAEEDFFNVAEYLTIRFVSSKISQTSKGLVAKGDLTLHGVTRNIAIPFTVAKEKGVTTLSGEIEIERDDHRLGTDKYGSSFVVGSTAQVKITCVLTQ